MLYQIFSLLVCIGIAAFSWMKKDKNPFMSYLSYAFMILSVAGLVWLLPGHSKFLSYSGRLLKLAAYGTIIYGINEVK